MLSPQKFYEPSEVGAEAVVAKRMEHLRALKARIQAEG